MWIDWGFAGLISGVGFGFIFVVLIILAVIVWLLGIIFKKISSRKTATGIKKGG